MIPREKRRALFEDQARWFDRMGNAHAAQASRRAADRLAPPASDLNYRWPGGEWWAGDSSAAPGAARGPAA